MHIFWLYREWQILELYILAIFVFTGGQICYRQIVLLQSDPLGITYHIIADVGLLLFALPSRFSPTSM